MDRKGINKFDPPVGLLKKGSIISYNSTDDTVQVQLLDASAIKGRNPLPVTVPAPHSMFFNNGMFIGTLPAKGTPVIVGEGRGGQHFFVSYLAENVPLVPTLTLGELLIQSAANAAISLDDKSNITIGSNNHNIHINAGYTNSPKTNLITINFENENHFNQAYREVGGLIKRDLKYNNQFDADTKLTNDNYDSYYQIIGMDPTATANDFMGGATKNPPLVEHRQLVYEYQLESNIDDDVTESNKYTNTAQAATSYIAPNRRNSRADTLSLSLVSPNFLIEEVKGTIVDIFGNILDLNRTPIPVGKAPTNTLRSSISTNQQQSFLNIRALERHSVAYHFELNARKDPNPQLPGSPPLDINADNYNAKWLRSRFFMDIDKEGMLKVNIPATSETSNIPLLVRYENYSTFGTDDNNNPNKLWYRDDNTDIFLDSFAAPPGSGSGHGSITIMNGNANATPLDRITNSHIKHGSPFHDILSTCSLQQNSSDSLGFSTGANPDPVDTSYITNLSDLVSTTIQVGGTGTPSAGGPNAGGRSGSINLDGSLEMSIGANTIDRQSLWLDTAGGMVANIGRDRNQRSAIMNFDGDVIMQIGGFGVSGDARFVPLGQDGQYTATLDLRVYAGGFAHMFRIDQRGVTVVTPGYFNIQAAQGINISSDTNMTITAETLTLNVGGMPRSVLPIPASV